VLRGREGHRGNGKWLRLSCACERSERERENEGEQQRRGQKKLASARSSGGDDKAWRPRGIWALRAVGHDGDF
jgi:hypothetical protein